MENKDSSTPSKGLNFILLSFIFWIIVEYILVWATRLNEWISYMPFIFLYYLGIVLIFWLLFYRIKRDEKQIFIIMVILMYPIEIILFSNALLLNPLWFIPHSIQLISIWGFLTFFPYWLVEKKIKEQNKSKLIFYLLWAPLGFLFAIILG